MKVMGDNISRRTQEPSTELSPVASIVVALFVVGILGYYLFEIWRGNKDK